MLTHITAPVTAVAEGPRLSELRHGVRTPTILSIPYSGLDSGQMLMGNGVITNLSSSGIGISGDRSVTPGMEAALFVDLPGVEKPLCIAQNRVSWRSGHRSWRRKIIWDSSCGIASHHQAATAASETVAGTKEVSS